jgi:hypothetical protein
MADTRVSVTVRLTKAGIEQVKQIAHAASTPERLVTASDVIRVALKHGLPAAQRELT